MNSFFAVLIALSILGFIVLEAITLYNKVTHQMLFHVPTTKYKSYILGTVLLFCVAIFGFQFTNPQPVTSAPSVKRIYKTKTVGKKELESAKLRAYVLAKISSKITSQSNSVEDLSDKVESAKKASSQSVNSRQESESKQAKKEVQQSSVASQSSTQVSNSTSADKTSKQGDLDTTTKKRIIGNKNSRIYHVPGQAGYHMNSQNAVHFQTEAQAQSAGYRKAKR